MDNCTREIHKSFVHAYLFYQRAFCTQNIHNSLRIIPIVTAKRHDHSSRT